MSQAPMPNTLQDLLNAMAGHFRSHPGAAASQVSQAISEIAARSTLDIAEPTHPLASDTTGLPETPDAAFNRALTATAGHLHWWEPDADRIPPGMTSKIRVCEVIGPNGMIHDEAFRAGLYLQAPDLVYDWHSHAADELYIVMSGTARWQAEGREPAHPHPISYIHHAPWQSHAMITAHNPLLALWAWTGDISFDTYRMD